jgi:hypothetical protein
VKNVDCSDSLRLIFTKSLDRIGEEEDMNTDSKMTFTGVREGGGGEVTGIQMMVQRGNERWTSRLLGPIEFAELMLRIHVFPPVKTDGLFLRIHQQGQITEENVALTEENIRFLGLSAGLTRRHSDSN